MTDTFLFSVIIPSYNRAAHLGNVISSFLAQEYPFFELIIVDDGSKDNTEEVVRSFTDKRIKYYFKNNGERGAARNFGAFNATGDYITFFDSDDIVYPYFLSHALKRLTQLGRPACYAQAFELVTQLPKTFPPFIESEKISEINERLLTENILACNGVFLRKDIAGNFRFSENRKLSGSEDRFLWLQIAANFPFYYSETVCSCLVNHAGRGELSIDPEKVQKRIDLLTFLLKTDKEIARFSSRSQKRILSSAYLLGAIKLGGFIAYKGKSYVYLMKAIFTFPTSVCRRNFYVALKQIAFLWK